MYIVHYLSCFLCYTEQRYYAQLGKVVRQTQAALSELHQQEVRRGREGGRGEREREERKGGREGERERVGNSKELLKVVPFDVHVHIYKYYLYLPPFLPLSTPLGVFAIIRCLQEVT